MKITKDLLRAMRRDAKAGRILQLSPEEGVALLDERKELREALDQACGVITNWRHKEAVAALALGEDEE